MKKSILLAVMVTVMGTAFAQNNVFDIHYNWDKMLAYSYQPGYPYGFGLAGGSFLSFGFGDGETEYRQVSTLGVKTEYYKPTWSLRCGWLGYSIDEDVTGWGAITFRPFVNLGLDFMSHFIVNNNLDWEKHTKAYFTFAPSLAMNVYMFNFYVGYEIVPNFKEMNGINFGVGFSIPTKNSVENPIKKK